MRKFNLNKEIQLDGLQEWFGLRAFNRKERITLYKKLIAFLEQGIDLYRSLTLIHKISLEAHGRWHPSTLVLDKTLTSISREGLEFSEAIGRFIPYTEASLIASGEKSGKIVHDLRICMVIAESGGRLQKTVVEAVAYPVFLLLLFFGMLIMLATSILPKLQDIQALESWPDTSKLLYTLVYGFYDYWPAYLFLLIAFTAGSIYSLNKWVHPVRLNYLDKLPPWNMYKIINSAVLLYSLSSLMKSGIPLTNAVHQIRMKSSPYIGHFLDKILDQKQLGANDGRAFNVGLLEAAYATELEAFGELNNFTHAMSDTAERMMDSTVESVKKNMAVFRSSAIILIGIVIIWTYSSFIMVAQNIAENT
jgi:type II secretory pathway component PulF